MPRVQVDFGFQRLLACVVWTALWAVLYLAGLFLAALFVTPPDQGYFRITVLTPTSGAYDLLTLEERGLRTFYDEETISATTFLRLRRGDATHTCVDERSTFGDGIQRRILHRDTRAGGPGEPFGDSARPRSYLAWYESIGLGAESDSATAEAKELAVRCFPAHTETESFRVLYQDTVYDHSIPGHEDPRILPTFTQAVFFAGWLIGAWYVFSRRYWPF